MKTDKMGTCGESKLTDREICMEKDKMETCMELVRCIETNQMETCMAADKRETCMEADKIEKLELTRRTVVWKQTNFMTSVKG